ncbi:cytochrome P450 [Sporodiniella umbellata]|nr:cytochrome P450 [Sporodiniella umbellata]
MLLYLSLIRFIQHSKDALYIFGALLLILYAIRKVIRFSETEGVSGTVDIPSPQGSYPFIGHLLLMAGRLGIRIHQWHQELGPIFKLKVGAQDWVFLGDRETAHELLVRQGISCSGRPDLSFFNQFLSPNDRGILFVDYNKQWKVSRKIFLALLSPKTIDSLLPVFVRESEKIVGIMQRQARLGRRLKTNYFTSLVSYNYLAASAFGIEGANSMEDPDLVSIESMVSELLKIANPTKDFHQIFPSLSHLGLFSFQKQKMKRFVEGQVNPFVSRLVQVACESKGESLVKVMDGIKEKDKLTDEAIVSLLTELLVAGVETTSGSISWAIAVLCHYPDVQERMIQEIDGFVRKHQRQPMFEERKELPYCLAFIKELFRFQPPVDYGLPHQTTKDDYVIRKGTVLVVNTPTFHFNPTQFQDPKVFSPERFLNDSRSIHAISHGSIKLRSNYAFGWGRRICPAIYFVEVELFLFFARLLTVCKIEPPILSTGDKQLPDFANVINNGFTITPNAFDIRLIERVERA